jgi:hypothetical protein
MPIEIAFDPGAPFEVDVVVEVPSEGMRLRFDPFYQRLRLIDVFDLSAITLVHQAAFSGSADTSFRLVTAIFGPTYPGYLESVPSSSSSPASTGDALVDHDFDSSSGSSSLVYVLQYPGLRFDFPVPPRLAPLYQSQDLAFSPPEGAPPACRLFIYFGFDLAAAVFPPPPPLSLPNNNTLSTTTTATTTLASLPYMEEVEVWVGGQQQQQDSATAPATTTTTTMATSLRFPTRRRSGGAHTALTVAKEGNTAATAATHNDYVGVKEACDEKGSEDGNGGKVESASDIGEIRLHVSTPQDVMALLGVPDLTSALLFKNELLPPAMVAAAAGASSNGSGGGGGGGGCSGGGGGGAMFGSGCGDTRGESGLGGCGLGCCGSSGGSGGKGMGSMGPSGVSCLVGNNGEGSGDDDDGSVCADYFYGYPEAGIDVQFCGTTHTVR